MIKECKLHKVETCGQEDSVLHAAQKISQTNGRHLYVIDAEGKPLGIISTVDINNKVVAHGKDAAKTKAGEVMNKPLEFVSTEHQSEFALKIMMRHNSLFCPVVENGKLVGAISYGDAFARVRDKLSRRS